MMPYLCRTEEEGLGGRRRCGLSIFLKSSKYENIKKKIKLNDSQPNVGALQQIPSTENG